MLREVIHAQKPALRGLPLLVDAATGISYTSHTDENAPATELAAWITALRQPAVSAGGYSIASTLPESLRKDVDPWGYHPEALDLMQALKARWDPASILVSGFLAS